MTSSASDPGPASAPQRSVQVEHLLEEMGRRWQAGERPQAEEYLTRHPELASQPDAVVELLYEEICLRQEHGETAAPEDVLRRFPRWEPQLRILLDCHDLLEGANPLPIFPEAGATLGEFRILAELARGSLGRVFLATQPELADRPVVLKLVPRNAQEHLSLARLQHTHIVPLFSVQDDPERNLRALCMPYFGGCTLACLLAEFAKVPVAQRKGEHVLGALRRVQSGLPLTLPVKGPACTFLGQASYVQAVCWLGACLADALQYAADRDLVHLDLKPSNVLLSADGQPMLLDFHLARSPLQAGEPAPEWVGGTPVYMPPEQARALAAVRELRPVPETVDGRADIYSLGVLLYEMLGGELPLPKGRAALSLPRHNPQVSGALARLVDRCLADKPSERYTEAAHLADDLRRHLNDLPLRGVADGPLEHMQKLRRRRPLALPLCALLLGVLGTGGLALGYIRNEAGKAEGALEAGREYLRSHQDALAIEEFKRCVTLVRNLPFQGGLAQEAQIELAALQLHQFVERLRELFGADPAGDGSAQRLEAECRAVWDKRALILERLRAGDGPSSVQVHADLLDLAVLWSDLRVRLAGAEGAAGAHTAALEVLEQAEAIIGPSCVLYRARAAHARQVGRIDVARTAENAAAQSAPRTAWEHYALGLSLFRAGTISEAAVEFDRALEMEPQALWPNFYLGRCAFQQEHYQDALIAFTACVTLAPNRAVFVYYRGRAEEGLGRFDLALRDYDRALHLDKSLAAAYLSRGSLQYQRQRYTDAQLDLLRARELGANPVLVHYDLALVRLKLDDRAGALANLRETLRLDPGHQEARRLQETLLEER